MTDISSSECLSGYMYLGWRHSNVWHSSSRKLYSGDPNTVNIRLEVISLEVLHKRNIALTLVFSGYVCYKKGGA